MRHKRPASHRDNFRSNRRSYPHPLEMMGDPDFQNCTANELVPLPRGGRRFADRRRDHPAASKVAWVRRITFGGSKDESLSVPAQAALPIGPPSG